MDLSPGSSSARTNQANPILCPSCGTPQPGSHRFCAQCGHSLSSPAATSAALPVSGHEEIDRVLESVDLERPYRILRLAGSILSALGWILLAAAIVAILSAIVTLALSKPLPVKGLALVEIVVVGIALALLLLAGSDLVDWVVDIERHVRESNLMLESLLRGQLR